MSLNKRHTDRPHALTKTQVRQDLIRLITCGSKTNGKSTLVRRLLYDTKRGPDNQHQSVESECGNHYVTQEECLDSPLLGENSRVQKEQNTDVAYRFFATEKRKFILTDIPEHKQTPRYMVTSASSAAVALVVVDAQKGLQVQTRSYFYLLSLLGIKHAIVAVNKIDLVDFAQPSFEALTREFRLFARMLNIEDVRYLPLSARDGDNIFRKSERTSWYRGQTLLEMLESIEVHSDVDSSAFRMPVQYVDHSDFHTSGYLGTIASGRINAGDDITVCPQEATGRVDRIVTANGDLQTAIAGQSVTLVLTDDLDANCGDVIASGTTPCQQTDQFAAHVMWMHSDAMLPERQYLMRIGTLTLTAQITDLRYTVNVNTLERLAAKKLTVNDIGHANFSLDHSVAFDAYKDNRKTGWFTLIDRFSNETLGIGLIDYGLRRATNLTWHESDITKASRSLHKGQKPCVLWFTGLSGSGKSTIANCLEHKLRDQGRHSYLLDGDNVRHGLNKDLGFTDQDRVENIRRVAEVSKLMVDAGLIVLVSFISPFRSERQMARELMENGEFIEVFMDTPLGVCELRDPKGLYQKARAGQIKNFTGIDSAYEPPEFPELSLSHSSEVEVLAERVMRFLQDKEII